MQLDTLLVNLDSLSELVIAPTQLDSLASVVAVTTPSLSVRTLLWTTSAVLLAAFVPLFLSALRSYSHHMGVMGSTLLIFRDLELKLTKHTQDIEIFAKDVRENPSKNHNLPLNTFLAYDWANNIPWQTVFDAARAVWIKSTDSINCMIILWRATIAMNTTYAIFQEKHETYFTTIRVYQRRFSINFREIIGVIGRYESEHDDDVDSSKIIAEIKKIQQTRNLSQNSGAKKLRGIKAKYDELISPLNSLCDQYNNAPITSDLFLPLAECAEAYVNIEALADASSNNYAGMGAFLNENRISISECLDGLSKMRFRFWLVIPWFTTYIAMRGRTLAWKRAIESRFASIDPQMPPADLGDTSTGDLPP